MGMFRRAFAEPVEYNREDTDFRSKAYCLQYSIGICMVTVALDLSCSNAPT